MDLEKELFVIVAAVLNDSILELDPLLYVTISVYNELSVIKLNAIELKKYLKKLVQTRSNLYTFEINEKYYEIESNGLLYSIIPVSKENEVILDVSKLIITEIRNCLGQIDQLNKKTPLKLNRSKGNVNLSLFIQILAAFILNLPSLKTDTSICGKQIQQLFIEWSKINENVPSNVPQRMYSRLPSEQRILIIDKLYILQTRAEGNGRCFLELCELENATIPTNNSITVPVELIDLAINIDYKGVIVENRKSDIRFLIPLIATLVYFSQDMKQKSSILGSDLRELYPRWKLSNPSIPKAIPTKIFSSMPQNCIVEIESILYNLTTLGNGTGEFFIELLELSDFNEESEIIIVDPILLNFFESDDSDQGSTDDSEHVMTTKIPATSEKISHDLSNLYKEKIEHKLLTNTRSEIVKRIQKKITDLEYPPCVVEIFGSTASNLAYKNADLDITVTSSFPDHPLKNMRKMATLLRKSGFIQVVPICNARVPICKFYDKNLKINCDINFGHTLGVHNSGLIRSYTMLDPRVKPLILLIKLWAKNRDINNPSSGGTISSYAYCLMVIAYLQHVGVLKNLQDQGLGFEKRFVKVPVARHSKNGRMDMREVDISYCRDLKTQSLKESISDSLKYSDSNMLWNATDGVPALFLGFFQFFCSEYNYSKKWCISIKDGGFLKSASLNNNSGLVVLDPFEKERNCTGIIKKKLKIIQEEFKRSIDMIENANIWRIFDSLSRTSTSDLYHKRFFKKN